MIFSLRALTRFTPVTQDGAEGVLQDVQLDCETLDIKAFVAVFGAGWTSAQSVFLPTLRVSGVDPRQGVLDIDAQEHELFDAPAADSSGLGVHSFWSRPGDFPLSEAHPGLFEFGAWAKAGWSREVRDFTAGLERGESNPSRFLLSWRELRHYSVTAPDSPRNALSDLLVDVTTWHVHALVVRIGGWLFGRDLCVSPEALQRVAPERRELNLDLTPRELEAAPRFQAGEPVNRSIVTESYDYYGRLRRSGGAVSRASDVPNES